MTFGKVTVFLILVIAFQAMCQDCGEAGNTGDGNAVSALIDYLYTQVKYMYSYVVEITIGLL